MDMMRMKAALLLAAALAFASAPFWSGGFGGFDPNLFPIPQVDPPVQPAGYAFSIWGLIYVWLIAHAAKGLLTHAEDPDWDAIRWPLLVSLALGTSWISVAVISPVWATLLIWIMFVSALAAVLRAPPARDRWLLAAPLGLYAGWLTAASFVALGMLGAGHSVIVDETGWAWIALAGALAVAITVQRRLPSIPEYPFAVAWALYAIAIPNRSSDPVLAGMSMLGAIAMALLGIRAARVRLSG